MHCGTSSVRGQLFGRERSPSPPLPDMSPQCNIAIISSLLVPLRFFSFFPVPQALSSCRPPNSPGSIRTGVFDLLVTHSCSCERYRVRVACAGCSFRKWWRHSESSCHKRLSRRNILYIYLPRVLTFSLLSFLQFDGPRMVPSAPPSKADLRCAPALNCAGQGCSISIFLHPSHFSSEKTASSPRPEPFPKVAGVPAPTTRCCYFIGSAGPVFFFGPWSVFRSSRHYPS